MSLSTYLTFDGNCREAFEFYRSVFGGEFAVLQTFADGPPDMPMPDGAEDLVMHVSLPVGSSVLMGSDRGPEFGPPLVAGNNFSISIQGQSREHCDDVYLPRCRPAARQQCRCRRCSGARTTACAPTNSASTG